MRPRSVLALVTVLALAACVSIDDRKLTEHGGDDDRGGSAGRGGSSGRGGGVTGGSTTGGSTGSGGSSGTSGSGPFGDVEDCDGDPLEVDEAVVRACLMQVGCGPFVPGVSLSFCITNQRLRTFSKDDCGTGVTNCDDFLDCRGQGYYGAADCTSGEPVLCETETLGVSCGRYPYAIDCAKFGGVCTTYTNDEGAQRIGCRIPELDGCTEAPETEQCSTSGVAYQCLDGTALGTDCPLTGSECREGSCYYVLPACSTPGTTCGTATRVDVCYDTNDVARYECAPGLGCEEGATGADCVAPGCAINEPCLESCSGTELTFCYGGVPVSLDCTDYGFRRCLESTPAGGTGTFAYCAFPDTAVDHACEPEDTDTACGRCAKTECCSAWTACLDSPDCSGYLDCTFECDIGDSMCISNCADMYPRGLAPSNAFFDCREAACSC